MSAVSNAHLSHSCIIVPDLDAAVQFFTNFLGFNVVRNTGPIVASDDTVARVYGMPERASGRMTLLESNGQHLELAEWASWGQTINPLRESSVPGAQVCVQVGDLDQAVNTLSTIPRMRFLERSPNGFVYAATPYGFMLCLVGNQYL